MHRLRDLPRALAACAALVPTFAACTSRPPVDVTPRSVGTEVRVDLPEPRDVVVVRAAGDSVLIPNVQWIAGRVAEVRGDTVLLRPVTSARAVHGVVEYPSSGQTVAARLVLERGRATTADRTLSGARTAAVVVVVVIALAAVVAHGLSDLGAP